MGDSLFQWVQLPRRIHSLIVLIFTAVGKGLVAEEVSAAEHLSSTVEDLAAEEASSAEELLAAEEFLAAVYSAAEELSANSDFSVGEEDSADVTNVANKYQKMDRDFSL